MSFSNEQIDAAFTHFSGNWGEIAASDSCACSFCLMPFEAGAVARLYEEIDGVSHERGVVDAAPTFTTVCPNCQLPYCLGDASDLPIGDPAFVQAVQQRWHR